MLVIIQVENWVLSRLTPLSRIFIEKLIVALLVRKLPSFLETSKFMPTAYDVSLCHLVDIYKYFGETYCIHSHSKLFTLKMETECFSVTLQTFYQTKRRHMQRTVIFILVTVARN
jgi:hypothetical protein